MAQEISRFGPLRPELDGVRKCVHCLSVAANEASTKIYVLKGMLFGLEIGDLADVVAANVIVRMRMGGTKGLWENGPYGVEQAAADILRFEPSF